MNLTTLILSNWGSKSTTKPFFGHENSSLGPQQPYIPKNSGFLISKLWVVVDPKDQGEPKFQLSRFYGTGFRRGIHFCPGRRRRVTMKNSIQKKSFSFELGNSVLKFERLRIRRFLAQNRWLQNCERLFFFKWTIFPIGIGNNFYICRFSSYFFARINMSLPGSLLKSPRGPGFSCF
jgi:hypothetical protein